MNPEVGQIVIRDGLEYKIRTINEENYVCMHRGDDVITIYKDRILKFWTFVNGKWYSKIGYNIFKCKCVGDSIKIKNRYGEYIINQIDENALQIELIDISVSGLCKAWVNVEILEL